jgi:hypothetical protein
MSIPRGMAEEGITEIAAPAGRPRPPIGGLPG